MNSNIAYTQSCVLIDENTPAMIPDADGLVSVTTLLCPGEASVSAPESISREYDELPLIQLEDLPPDQIIDPAHEYYHEKDLDVNDGKPAKVKNGPGAENVGVKPAGKKRTK